MTESVDHKKTLADVLARIQTHDVTLTNDDRMDAIEAGANLAFDNDDVDLLTRVVQLLAGQDKAVMHALVEKYVSGDSTPEPKTRRWGRSRDTKTEPDAGRGRRAQR